MMEELGVKTTFISAGRYKVEGNSYEPLTDEARAAMQARIDSYYNTFTTDLSRFRSADAETIKNGFGQGRTVPAYEAVRLGMADKVQSLDTFLESLANTPTDAERRRRRLRIVTR
jgi:ClpP class serine protease